MCIRDRLNAASDIGSMCIIAFLAFVPLRKNQGKILLVAVAGFGLCIIGFGWSKFYWLSFGLLMLSGMLDGISVSYTHLDVYKRQPWVGGFIN